MHLLSRLLLTAVLALTGVNAARAACTPTGDPAMREVYLDAGRAQGDAVSSLLLGRFLEHNPWCDDGASALGRQLQAQARQAAGNNADIAMLLVGIAPEAERAALLATVSGAANDNAYFALALASLPGSDAATRDGWLAIAARAPRYAPTQPKALRALETRFATVRKWPGVQGALSPEDARGLAFSAATALSVSAAFPLGPLVKDCAAPSSPAVRASCRGVAAHLQGSTRLLDVRVGARLGEKLAVNDAERASAKADIRQVRWLAQQVAAWQQGDPALSSIVGRRYIATVLASGEIAAMRQSLRDRGVAVAPPADWKDPTPAQ